MTNGKVILKKIKSLLKRQKIQRTENVKKIRSFNVKNKITTLKLSIKDGGGGEGGVKV